MALLGEMSPAGGRLVHTATCPEAIQQESVLLTSCDTDEKSAPRSTGTRHACDPAACCQAAAPIAFAGQQPWIMNGSWKENIVMGSEWDAERFWQVSCSAALSGIPLLCPSIYTYTWPLYLWVLLDNALACWFFPVPTHCSDFLAPLRPTYFLIAYQPSPYAFAPIPVPLRRGHEVIRRPSIAMQVMAACALEEDVAALPSREDSSTGDRGSLLSGGQRSRLALARALYQPTRLCLLDDVLASVDNRSASCIVSKGLLGPLMRGRTVVLCTKSAACIAAADLVVRLDAGRIDYCGPAQHYPAVVASSQRARGAQSSPDCSLQACSTAVTANCSSNVEEGQMSSSSTDCLKGISSKLEESKGRSTASAPDSAVWGEAERLQAAEESRSTPTVCHSDGMAPNTGASESHDSAVEPCCAPPAAAEEEEEEREVGHVKWQVYVTYARAVGSWMAAAVLISLLLMQASKIASDLWISHWVSVPGAHSDSASVQGDLAPSQPAAAAVGWASLSKINLEGIRDSPSRGWKNSEGGDQAPHDGARDSQRRFLHVLAAIAAANGVFTLVRAFSFAKAGLSAARDMHSKLLTSVLYAPQAFLDCTPLGRLLNRFSSDTVVVDDSLPFIMNIFLANAVSLLGVLCVVCYGQPLLVALLLPLAVVYRYALEPQSIYYPDACNVVLILGLLFFQSLTVAAAMHPESSFQPLTPFLLLCLAGACRCFTAAPAARSDGWRACPFRPYTNRFQVRKLRASGAFGQSKHGIMHAYPALQPSLFVMIAVQNCRALCASTCMGAMHQPLYVC